MFRQTRSILRGLWILTMVVSLAVVCHPPSGLAQAKFPTGIYTSGQFKLTFFNDGSHTVSANDAVVVKGGYTVTQDQIVLTDKEGQFACDAAQQGKYRWKVEEKKLTFEKLEDECDGRASALTSQTWVKQ